MNKPAVREVYYEVYFDGKHRYEGALEDCREIALKAIDDDLVEVYEVTIFEEKIYV